MSGTTDPSGAKPTESPPESELVTESSSTQPATMSPATDSSSSDANQTDSPPPESGMLVIEPLSIQPITRHQHCLDSKSRLFEISLKWVIENFSYYCLDETGTNHFPVINSSYFQFPLNDSELLFRLKLYPKGYNEENKNNVSLFVKLYGCEENNEEIVLKYRLYLIDSNGLSENVYESRQKFTQKNNFWGAKKFCSLEDIFNSSSRFVPGDVLTIFCEMTYEDEDFDDSLDEIALDGLKEDCVELKRNKELSDVVLVFGDGEDKKEFHAHKAILGARSEVFGAMFEHDMREKKDNQVEMTDVDAEVGEELLDYLYSEMPDLGIYAYKLLPIADKYRLLSLKSVCEGALCFRINPESVGNLLLLADMHNAALLKSKCIEYIHCHSICVVENESMKDLIQIRPEIFHELFNYIPQDPSLSWSPTSTVDPFMWSWSYSDSRVGKCSKRWTIGQFEDLHLSVDEDYFIIKLIELSSFSASKPNEMQFTGKLYPHGENDDCKGYLSLYLQLKCDEMMKVAVKAKVSIVVDENKGKGYTLEIGKKLSDGESIGWPKFIALEKLLQNKDVLLNGYEKKLVILCEVFYIENIDKPVTEWGENTFEDEHKFSLAHDLSKLYESQKLTDAVFVLGHKEFKVHKSIVLARSKVFSRMFIGTNRVQIDDVEDVEAFERMIALVYGQTEGLTQWALKMLPLLDKFQLNSLKQVCQLALYDQLNDDNVAGVVRLADKHNARLLKAKAIEYICRNHSTLVKNDTLKVVQQQNPELFYEVLCYKLEDVNVLSQD